MEWTVAIGVDTHRDRHVAVAVDRLGRTLGSLELAVDERGYARLIDFARSCGVPAFSVEGTGSYGASLARALLAEGFAVYECERPERRSRNDKNDLIDAEQAARRLLTGKRLPLPRTGAEREHLRLLLAERRSCQHARLQALNQLKAAIITLDPPLRAKLSRLQPARLNRQELGDATFEKLREAYEAKEKQIGGEGLRYHERMIMLSVLDTQWKDHLLSMDHLKEGIGLRGDAQRDPLVEYKRESFDMFEEMMQRFQEDTARYLFSMQIVGGHGEGAEGGPEDSGPVLAGGSPAGRSGGNGARPPATSPRRTCSKDPRRSRKAFAEAMSSRKLATRTPRAGRPIRR